MLSLPATSDVATAIIKIRLVLTGVPDTPPALTFTISPEVITAGQSCTLTWASDADAVFLSAIGRVEPSGTRTVTPSESTTYILIAQHGDRIEMHSVIVHVHGAKSVATFPDVDDFQSSPIITKRSALQPGAYVAIIDSIHKTLHEGMGFSVRGDFLPHRPYYVLYTDLQARRDLTGISDIATRKLAYAVRVNAPADGIVSIEVRAMLESERADDATAIREATETLATALSQVHTQTETQTQTQTQDSQ